MDRDDRKVWRIMWPEKDGRKNDECNLLTQQPRSLWHLRKGDSYVLTYNDYEDEEGNLNEAKLHWYIMMFL